MAFHNQRVVFSCSSADSIDDTPLLATKGNTLGHLSVHSGDGGGTGSLDSDELLAAWLARESHVGPMLRLMMEMSEEQRRLSLIMMQCMALGHQASPTPGD